MATEEDCKQALDIYADMLSGLPHVQGLGVGERLTAGKSAGDCAVNVYVSKKVPRSELGNDAVPKTLSIVLKNGERKEIPVEVIETGELKLQ